MTRIEAIAFDLDMTLVDSRAVSRRALERLVCEYGAKFDIDTLMSAYGRPLPGWLPASIDGALFRTLQSQDIALAVAMPGAGAALAAVRQAGARVVVVTSAPLAIAIGVNTGTTRPIGAQVELEDLTAFPSWLADRTLTS